LLLSSQKSTPTAWMMGLPIPFPIPVRFSAWVILTERYRVTLAKRRSAIGFQVNIR
jgi:hypothetical protein